MTHAPIALNVISEEWELSLRDKDFVDLAMAPSFQLGAMLVDPSGVRVSALRGEESLEPRVMQVLVVLAEAAGAVVSRDELTRRCWNGRIVGDDAINRVIGRLRRLAAGLGGGSFAIETITKVGYRLVVATGAEPVLPTPAAGSAVLDPPRAQPARRILDIRAIALAALIVAVLTAAIGWRMSQTPVGASHPRVVLENFAVGGAGLAGNFGQATRDAMVSTYGRAMRMEVLAPGTAVPAGGWRMTGEMSSTNDYVQVYGHLFRANSNEESWSPHLAIPLAHVSADDIGQALIGALRCIVEADADTGGATPRDALAAFAQYCQENSWNDYDVQRQLEALRATVRADPQFFPAWNALGIFLREAAGTASPEKARALLAEGRHAALTALRLNPQGAGGYMALSHYLPASDYRERERLLRLALAKPPDGECWAQQDYAYFLADVGRIRETLEEEERALDIDPENQFNRHGLAKMQYYSGEYGLAKAGLLKGMAAHPESLGTRYLLWEAAITAQDWPMAHMAIAQLPEGRLTTLQGALVDALASESQPRIDAVVARFRAMAALTPNEKTVAIEAMAAGGHGDEAVALIAREFDEGKNFALSTLYQPSLRAARHGKAFEDLVKRSGLLAYWRDTHQPPDFCRETDRPAVCSKV